MKNFLERNSGLFFLLGFNLITFIACILILTATGYVFHVPISKFHLPAAAIVAFLLTILAAKIQTGHSGWRTYLQLVVPLAFSYAMSFIIAAFFYDISFDGQTYHQEAIIQLNSGWVPFYENVASNISSHWINHYAKGVEIPQAAIYAVFGKIEAGKATNVLLIIASFFLCLSALLELSLTSSYKSLLLAVAFALNPVAVCQALTYYIDGQLASLLLCLLSTAVLLYLKAEKFRLLLFGFCIIILLNVKFTSFGFVGLITISLLVFLYLKTNWTKFAMVFFTAALASLIAVLWVGFNPYITNSIKHHHPFYPLAGPDKTDIFSYNCPQELYKKNRVEKFFISAFSKTEDINGDAKPTYKIPFAFEWSELQTKYQTRIAGLGFWFSGILTLTITLLILLLYIFFRTDKSLLLQLLIVSIMFTVSIFMISEPWWARYIPHLWFFPLIVILYGEYSKNFKARLLSRIVLFCALANMTVVFSYNAIYNYARTKEVQHQLAELKKQKAKPIRIDFGLFESNRIRLREHQIPYKIEHFEIEDSTTQKIVYSRARYKL